MNDSVTMGTEAEPYITGEYAGWFVYASPNSEEVLYWPPAVIQLA